MKNPIPLMLALTCLQAHADIPKSSGHDLYCDGQVELSSPWYHCETSYGPSETCREQSARATFLFKEIKGEFAQGLSGSLELSKITSLGASNDQSNLIEQVKQLVQNISGTVNYKAESFAMSIATPIGSNSLTTQADFTEGKRVQTKSIGLAGAGKYGEVVLKDSQQVLTVYVSCVPGNTLNDTK